MHQRKGPSPSTMESIVSTSIPIGVPTARPRHLRARALGPREILHLPPVRRRVPPARRDPAMVQVRMDITLEKKILTAAGGFRARVRSQR